MDGYVVIETDLDTENFDKDIQKLLKENEKSNKEKIKIEAEINVKGQEFDRKMKEIQDKAKIDIAAISGGSYYTRKAKEQKISETAQLKMNTLVEKYNDYLAQADQKIKDIETHQTSINRKLEQMNKEKDKADFSKIGESLKNIGKETDKTAKKFAKWALAIMSIRGVFGLIRQSMSTLSQYNDDMAQKLSNIKLILATALEPVINRILSIVITLVNYLNYLTKAWFNMDLFARASELSSQKMAKNLSKASGAAKELNKQLAGFDEMNILQNNMASGGGADGIDTSQFEMPEVEIPEWLKWIVENKEIILSVIGGITAGLIAWKSGLGAIKALGIGVAIAGLVYTIQKIIDFLNDPTFNNFIGILEGIAIAIGGVAIAIGAWPVAIGADVALVVIEIVKHFDWIMNLLDNFIAWMDKNFLGALKYLFGPLGNLLYAPFSFFFNLARTAFENFYGGIKKIVEGIILIFNGDFWGGIKKIFEGLFDILWAPFKGLIDGIKGLWNSIKGFLEDLVRNINNVLAKINPINILGNIGNWAWGGIKNIGGGIADFFGFAKGGVVYNNPVKLASGAVINRPGAGVPISHAIGGERGMEGIIPLTDSQQMELLGQSIGRYITVNLTNVNEMNGRIISREMKRMENENDFAFNK